MVRSYSRALGHGAASTPASGDAAVPEQPTATSNPAATAGAISLFTATHLGVPVSTTHTITGAIVGVGAALPWAAWAELGWRGPALAVTVLLPPALTITAQLVLGTFTGTFAYCLIVLRTVHGDDGREHVEGVLLRSAGDQRDHRR